MILPGGSVPVMMVDPSDAEIKEWESLQHLTFRELALYTVQLRGREELYQVETYEEAIFVGKTAAKLHENVIHFTITEYLHDPQDPSMVDSRSWEFRQNGHGKWERQGETHTTFYNPDTTRN